MALPVVVVTTYGLPVTVVTNGYGLPVEVAANGIGMPVIVVPSGGMPVVGLATGPDVTAPIITSSNAISQPENAVLNHILSANETVTWAKVGGADTAKFTLVGNTLTLPAKDFENPDDAGLNNTYIVQVQATDTASNVSLVQTITVTITDVFEVGPTAPVLAMDPAWTTTDATPDFTIDIDDTIGAGDSIQLQIQAAGGDWSSPIEDVTHVITAPEDTANEIALSLGSQSNASYEARARVSDGTPSAWSNVVSFTVAAVASGHGLMWNTDAIMWGADYMVWETPPFTPASLSPALWIEPGNGTAVRTGMFKNNDGATGAVTTNGDAVAYIPDLSGNNFHLSTNATGTSPTDAPTIQGIGTLPYLNFDGSNDMLRRLAALSMYGSSAGFTVAVVLRSNSNAVSSHVVAEGFSSTLNTIIGPLQASSAGATISSANYRNDVGTSTGVSSPNGSNLANAGTFNATDKVFIYTDDGTSASSVSNIATYVNGVAGAAITGTFTRNGTVVTTDRFALGALLRNSVAGGSFWAGRVYGVVIVKRVLNSTERANLTTYLGNLAGLSL